MDSFKEKALVLNDIRSKFTQFQNNSDLISMDFHTSFRQQLFADYGYDPSIYIDEASFFKLFESQFDNEMPTEIIHQDEISKIQACFGEIVKTKYLDAVNSAHKFCRQKCRDQKKAALRDIFMLPSGNKDHVIEILKRIDSSFVDMLSRMIKQFQVTIGLDNTDFISVKNLISTNIRFNDEIKQILENYFCEVSDRPKHCEKLELSKTTGLTIKQIETWFNNRRNRAEKDNEKLERLTTEFLDKKVDWEDKFTAARSGKITAKDMKTIIIQAFELPCIDSIEEDDEELLEIETTRSNELFLEKSDSSSFKKSVKTRERLTKKNRKNITPYTKSSPMSKKMAIMRVKDNISASVVDIPCIDLIEDEEELPVIEETITMSNESFLEKSNSSSFKRSVKTRERLTKETRKKASPYTKSSPMTTKIAMTRINHVQDDISPPVEEIQHQDLNFNFSSSFEGDIFNYVSTYAPTTSFSNLSDISEFSQLSDVVDFDQLNDISAVNSYSTLPFALEQCDSLARSSNDPFNAVTVPHNLSEDYLNYTSNSSIFVTSDTTSEQESAVDMTNTYDLFNPLPDDINAIQLGFITQSSSLGNSNFTIDSLGEHIDHGT
ncbi:4373_t:CDS:2 [Scutellospora calospora]|uniref:4373_t:CDS:1 n=1 Tax=Scutellospora calospora TaxID=85575 RepID=A0ACA9LK09_9GLOM|nr:4373_t:CDS:2 [Scutellospora calospora]